MAAIDGDTSSVADGCTATGALELSHDRLTDV